MGTRSSTAQKFFSDEISRALSRAGLDYNHPIREVLDRKAEIVGVRDGTKRHFVPCPLFPSRTKSGSIGKDARPRSHRVKQ